MKPLFRRSKKTLADSKSLERIGLDFDERKDRQTLVSFSPPRFSDRKKTLGDSKSSRKNRVIISMRGKIAKLLFRSHLLISIIEKNPRKSLRKNRVRFLDERKDRWSPSFVFTPSFRRKKILADSKSPTKNRVRFLDERKHWWSLCFVLTPSFRRSKKNPKKSPRKNRVII